MDLTSIEPPETGIRMEDNATLVYIDNVSKGTGTLYVSESDIRWLNSSGVGITLHYPDISVFAICTDREKYQEDCLFLLVKVDKPASEDEEDELDIDYSNEAEIRFVPSGGVAVHDVFRAIQDCNKLHPNENDDIVSEDSDTDHGLGDASMVLNGNNGDHVPGQFDDAE